MMLDRYPPAATTTTTAPPPPSIYDPSRAVKRFILELIPRLDIARLGHHALSADEIDAACDAAKTIRTRLVREYERVRKRIEAIKQKLYLGESGELREAGGGVVQNEEDEDDAMLNDPSSTLLQGRLKQAIHRAIKEDQSHLLTRTEFQYLGELHTVERVVIPALIAHGLQHRKTLLPQLLKLIAAATLPVVADAPDVTVQCDIVNAVRERCATDEFFVLLVHAVAPVASKRKDGPLSEDDTVLLEIVLSLMTHLLQGSVAAVEPTVGAMCRNHGVELILVLLTQNFAKYETLMKQHMEDTGAVDEEEETDEDEEEEEAIHHVTASRDNTEQQGSTTTEAESATLLPTVEDGEESSALQDDHTPHLDQRLGAEGTLQAAATETQLVIVPELPEDVDRPIDARPTDALLYPETGEVAASEELEELVEDAVEGEVVEIDVMHPSAGGNANANEAEEEDEEDAEEEEEDAEEDEEEEEMLVVGDDDAEILRKNPKLQRIAEDIQQETIATLRRWNDYLLEIVSLVFRCAPVSELPIVALALQELDQQNASGNNTTTTAQLAMLSTQLLQSKLSVEMKRQSRIDEEWRRIARSRNGAFNTNSLLVRKATITAAGSHFDDMQNRPTSAIKVLGPTSSLMGKRADPLGLVKELDRRKKGRFHKSMLEQQKYVSSLSLPTQVHLTQQFVAFLSHGFERLSAMLWPNVKDQLKQLDEDVKETLNLLGGGADGGIVRGGAARRRGGAAADGVASKGGLMSVLTNVAIKEVMSYMFLCGTLLRFTRENLKYVTEWRQKAKNQQQQQRQQRDMSALHQNTRCDEYFNNESIDADADAAAGNGADEALAAFEAQWKAVSHIITLDHVQAGLTLLDNFLDNRELASEEDVSIPMNFVAELVLLLVHLMDGDIVEDPVVTMAAHAMGSSLLYREENIHVAFRLSGQVSFRQRPTPNILQSLMLLLHAMLMLMSKCSYNGTLPLPKQAPRQQKANGGDGVMDPVAAAGGSQDRALVDDDEEEEDEEEGEDEAMTTKNKFIVSDDAEESSEEGEPPSSPKHAKSNDDDDDRNVTEEEEEEGNGVANTEIDGEALVEQMRREEAFRAKQRLLLGIDDHTADASATEIDVTLKQQHHHDVDLDEISLEEGQRPPPRPSTTTGVFGEDQGNINEADNQAKVDESTEEAHLLLDVSHEEGDDLLHRARSQGAVSEESASIIHSSHTGHSSLVSEREVKVQDFYLKLATPRQIAILYYATQSWLTNDADTNLALVSILENFLDRSLCVTALFNFPFLLIFHDILAAGGGGGAYETHRPLFDVVDKIVYHFFNPEFAKPRHRSFYQAASPPIKKPLPGETTETTDDNNQDNDQDVGPDSMFGMALSLRCTRALFMFHPAHYGILEDQLVSLDQELAVDDFEKEADLTRLFNTGHMYVEQRADDNEHPHPDIIAVEHDKKPSRKPKTKKTTQPRSVRVVVPPSSGPNHDDDDNEEEVDFATAAARKNMTTSSTRRTSSRTKRARDTDDDDDDDDDDDEVPVSDDASKANRKSSKSKTAVVVDGSKLKGLSRSERKRLRREEKTRKRKALLRTTGENEEEGEEQLESAAAYAPGTVIVDDNGTQFMVYEDGYAYQVEGDADNGYRFVEEPPGTTGGGGPIASEETGEEQVEELPFLTAASS